MKFNFLILFLLLSTSFILAQDDEYIIKDPSKKERKPLLFNQLENPDYTNYFLMPTAFTLKKREIRLATSDVIFVKASYGLTHNTTVSVNASAFTMFTFALKQSIEVTEDITIAATISGGQFLALNPDTTAYIVGSSLLASFGDIQNNLTAGVGFFYLRSNFDFVNEERELTFLHFFIGAQRQISRRVFLVIDGIYFPTYQVYTGGIGTKITIKETMSIGVGVMPFLWSNISTNGNVKLQPIAIPLLSFKMLLNKW